MLIDSNLIIYSAKPEHGALRTYIAKHEPSASLISQVEVLGYHKLVDEDRKSFEKFFAAAPKLPVSESIVAKAISLRQTRKMSLGDSLLAATALIHSLKLITHNTSDFSWIPGLIVIDPLAPADAP